MRRFLSFGPAFVVLIATCAVLLVAPSAVRRIGAAQTQAVVAVAQRSLDQDDVLERVNAAIRSIATAVEPSVVHIDVFGASRGPAGASGSGWVYDGSGHIVTNAHVVADASDVVVQFYDGHVTQASIVGADADSDIAVLKVEGGEDRVAIRRATGDRVQIGDRVFSFGSPFGFKFSMSEGIVSGLGRSARTPLGQARISNFIQTDAAVNPGNSGGPLVDIRGRVVGMNVAIATAADVRGDHEGQSAGISFAIPLGTIESRVRQILSGGPIVSGYLGVWFTDTRGIVQDGKPKGVPVDDVIDDGPADKAGVKPGDIVISIDGEPVADGSVLSSIISSRTPGDTIQLRIWRDGKTIDLAAAVAERPDSNPIRQAEQRLRRRFGLELRESEGRVIVGKVTPASPADLSGFIDGQLIAGIEGRPVATIDAAVDLLGRFGLFRGRPVRIAVGDAANPKELTLKLAESK